jgi:hypothetical protein
MAHLPERDPEKHVPDAILDGYRSAEKIMRRPNI